MTAYTQNREAASDLALDASLVAGAVKKLLEQGPCEGTASELLDALSTQLSEKEIKAKSLPKNAIILSNALRCLAQTFREAHLGQALNRFFATEIYSVFWLIFF